MPTTEKRLTKLEVELEQLNSKIDTVLEVVIPTHQDVQVMKEDINQIKLNLENHEIDIDLLKFAIKQHSKDIKVLQKYLPS